MFEPSLALELAAQSFTDVWLHTEIHWSELLANVAQALVLVAGVWVWFRWRRERGDRATTILLELEDRFSKSDVARGRELLDDPEQYAAISEALFDEVRRSVDSSETVNWVGAPTTNAIAHATADPVSAACSRAEIGRIDALLRFYVLVNGVLLAKQIPVKPLRACFRYYLSHVANPSRWAFRLYALRFYPTLRKWLDESAKSPRHAFFKPEEFRWRQLRPQRTLHWDANRARPRENAITRRSVIREVRSRLQQKVLVITGAGVSKASRLSTFREPDSENRHRHHEELARLQTFSSKEMEVLDYYHDRRVAAGSAEPNVGHRAITQLWRRHRARLDKKGRSCSFLLVTQNVDDLHERSRISADDIVHVHGVLWENRCMTCETTAGEHVVTDLPGGLIGYAASSASDANTETKRVAFIKERARHADCGRLSRPNVVFFDEAERESKRVEEFILSGDGKTGCDLVLVVGTMASFPYIARWIAAAGAKGLVVEINPDDTLVSDLADIRLRGKAEQVLPHLMSP